MLQTYKAVPKGNQLEWLGEIPEALQAEQAVIVEVTILDELAAARRAWTKNGISLAGTRGDQRLFVY